jgi:hypothetical protein
MKTPPSRITGNNLTGTARSRRPLTRPQRTVVVYGILCLVLTLVILQLWLLTATMNAFLGGDTAVILPAAIGSIICLALNLGLLRYLYAIERNPTQE